MVDYHWADFRFLSLPILDCHSTRRIHLFHWLHAVFKHPSVFYTTPSVMQAEREEVYHVSSQDVEAPESSDGKITKPDSSSAMSTSDGKIMKDSSDIVAAGEAKYHRLGWKQLTLMLIVEAIALGSLSIPTAFATLGMVAGILCCVGIGFIAIYTSYVIGQVKLAFPSVHHYGDAGTLMMGRFGYELLSIMFLLHIVFVTGSHCLTGTIALVSITGIIH